MSLYLELSDLTQSSLFIWSFCSASFIFLMFAKMTDKLKINLVNTFRSPITSTVKQQRGNAVVCFHDWSKQVSAQSTDQSDLWPFSLLPLAEQSDLPGADSVAHSTATQAQQGGICAAKQLHRKRQNTSFPLDWISQLPNLAHQAARGGDGSAGWWWMVLNGSSAQSKNTQRLV